MLFRSILLIGFSNDNGCSFSCLLFKRKTRKLEVHKSVDLNIEEAARSFFKELRRLDNSDIDIIFAAGVPETGMGIAVMDRMRKAAAYNITLI